MADVQYVTLYLHDGTPVQAIAGTVLYQVYLNSGATLYPSQTPPGSGIPTDPADPFPQYTTDDELAAALAALPTGGDGTVTTANITDATTTGRTVLTAPDAAAARAAIGAGTSDLTVGTTSTTAKAGNYTPPVADLPAGTTLTVLKTGSTWPARPTSRTDIFVAWKGADPSPSIVASGTGGMLDNVDYRLVTP